ncbi:hypothetical protein ACIREO_21870 [Streptomyces sp. NPDC102441]|uniref:hypothetical protein n=1 Tax=Streptomyces sp. NPDC102441 TaxID=3366176 RepID=UPI00381C8E0D
MIGVDRRATALFCSGRCSEGLATPEEDVRRTVTVTASRTHSGGEELGGGFDVAGAMTCVHRAETAACRKEKVLLEPAPNSPA